MNKQRVLTFDGVCGLDPQTTVLWVTPSVRTRVQNVLPFPVLAALQPLPAGIRTLIVVGGGTLLDEIKVWRLEQAPALELIAIPSIWGSGAEASPIAVRNRAGKKDIRLDDRLRPDARAIWPELAAGISPARARLACGDCWAHALEGFLSPLANEALRIELAGLMKQMLDAPLANDPVWFEFSAQAVAGPAQSSVGLVHGVAHTLEGLMTAGYPGEEWGHARLCSLFLWPVMRYNAKTSTKFNELLTRHGLDAQRVMDILHLLFDEPAYGQTLPVLKEYWMAVLRDPCSRTNSALVRPASLDYFVNKEFL